VHVFTFCLCGHSLLMFRRTSSPQALHAKRCATPDHTTLLLNCYTKLKDVDKLNDFIRTENGLQVFSVMMPVNGSATPSIAEMLQNRTCMVHPQTVIFGLVEFCTRIVSTIFA
jgi:hypothetical protein